MTVPPPPSSVVIVVGAGAGAGAGDRVGSVKTRSGAAKMWQRKSYCKSRRVSGSASWCFIANAFRRANDELREKGLEMEYYYTSGK